jgi:hypothetical protein
MSAAAAAVDRIDDLLERDLSWRLGALQENS